MIQTQGRWLDDRRTSPGSSATSTTATSASWTTATDVCGSFIIHYSPLYAHSRISETKRVSLGANHTCMPAYLRARLSMQGPRCLCRKIIQASLRLPSYREMGHVQRSRAGQGWGKCLHRRRKHWYLRQQFTYRVGCDAMRTRPRARVSVEAASHLDEPEWIVPLSYRRHSRAMAHSAR